MSQFLCLRFWDLDFSGLVLKFDKQTLTPRSDFVNTFFEKNYCIFIQHFPITFLEKSQEKFSLFYF
jgi:hypothetical protein